MWPTCVSVNGYHISDGKTDVGISAYDKLVLELSKYWQHVVLVTWDREKHGDEEEEDEEDEEGEEEEDDEEEDEE